MVTAPIRTQIIALACVMALVIPPGVVVRTAAVAEANAPTGTAPKPAPQPATASKPSQPTTTGARPSQRAPSASQPQGQAIEPDGGWPRSYGVAGGGIATLYQPQIASWENQTHMVAWSAVSYQGPAGGDPVLGTIKIEAQTKVAPDDRLVSFSDFRIAEFNFPNLSREKAQDLAAALQKAVPVGERVIALDRALAAMDKSAIVPKNNPDVKADPPQIFVSTRPAVLVNLDGDPIWSPIQGSDLKFAVNTNWDLFETPSKTLYLRNNDKWLTASDLKGPWSPAGTLPASFAKLPANDNWKDAKANIPGRPSAAGAVPMVYVSTSPAEMLLLQGAPAYQPVPNTSLLWVSNTDSDVFRFGKAGNFYYLVAGRWFSAPSLNGPWTFATAQLPEDFKKIPVDHARSRVLASVPGTEQAAEAVVLAEIPHTARVNVKELKAPEVTYDGQPEFQPIQGTTLARAVNTDKDIVKVGDLYYMCFQAVWFVSHTPTGPWEVARSVPGEIYTIPASSPINHVTYVTVEDDDPNDEWVDFAYAAGYTGMMIAWGTAVWGTGWYYPPYTWYGGVYPGYYGYARTYGANAWYNPRTGVYGRGGAVYGPYGGAGAGAVYNPRTGTYARGAAAYGPYGGRAVAQGFNPRTGTYAQTRQGGNIYGNWGSSYVQRGDDWARTSHVTNNRTGATTSTIRGDDRAAATRVGTAGRTTVGRGASGDIYAGHDGNVYRRSDSGSWQQWNNGGWNQAQRPSQSTQLQRDYSARAQGAQRTSDFSSFQRSPSMGRAGSFGGGGGFRGGGGGFRGGGRR